MKSSSKVYKFYSKKWSLRASAVDATEAVRAMQSRLNSYPIATVSVGQSMIAATLMASHLKQGSMVSLYLKGDGPLGKVFAESNYEGEVRGYTPNPQLERPLVNNSLDIPGAIGKGTFSVVRSDEQGRAPYSGQVEIQKGQVAYEVSHYMFTSMQIPVALNLGVHVNEYGKVESAGGILVELLPGYSEETVDELEKTFSVDFSVSNALLGPQDIREISFNVLAPFELEEIESFSNMVYKCKCSRERIFRALKMLSSKDLKDVIKEDNSTEVKCEFCGELYKLNSEELAYLKERVENKDKKLH